MTLPLHELAALGSATCWATTGLIAADAIRALGAFWFNLIRQVFVTLFLAAVALSSGSWVALHGHGFMLLALSGLVCILLGDTFDFAAVGRLGPRRAGAIFALNAPVAAILGRAVLGEALPLRAAVGIALTAPAWRWRCWGGRAPMPTGWSR